MAKLNKHVSVAPKQLISRISTTTMPMITKINRVVTYLEETLPIKPHDSLIRWYSEIIWEIKNISYEKLKTPLLKLL